MLTYRPNDDEAAVAMTVARRRNSLNGGQSNLPGGETASEDERLRQHYVACLSEIAVSRTFNLAWTGCGKGALGLRDVGNAIEVRAITEPQKGLLVRPKDDEAAPFVLVYVDTSTRECQLRGWAHGHEVRTRGRMIDGDTRQPCWVMRASDLLPVEDMLR